MNNSSIAVTIGGRTAAASALSRRLLGLSAAGLALAASSRPALAWVQEATPSADLLDYAGQTVNVFHVTQSDFSEGRVP